MNTGRAADITGTVANGFVRQVQQFINLFEGLAGQPNPTRITVINKDCGMGKLLMKRMGYPTDIIAVTENQQGKYGNRSMLKGMDTAHEMILLPLYLFLHLFRDLNPHAFGFKNQRR